MSQKKNLILTACLVLVLSVVLWPMLVYLQDRTDETGQTQREIEKMYVRYEAYLQSGSPGRVEPLMEMEEAWAIEDSRSEAAGPLVTGMYNGASELGFDRDDNTFYCSVGINREEWPELHLTMRGSDGVRVAWIDDYVYDSCSDAVREGYRYELLAYTRTEYCYFGLVFTGLPIVNIEFDEEAELTREDQSARISISSQEYEAINTPALIHRRGGRFDDDAEKASFHVEFHEISAKGKDKKPELSVLGMEADSDWLLISHEGDDSCMRNELAFDLWRKWNEDGNAFALLNSRIVEVFFRDEYMGLYQLLQRIQPEKELTRMNGSLNGDVVARLIGKRFHTGRPVSTISLPIGGCMELRYAPEWMDDDEAFALMQNYVTLNLPKGDENCLDDEAFAQLALSCVDVREMMSYYLYMNVCSLPIDNVKNNVYIWARWDGEKYRYTLSPWDMDSGFWPMFTDGSDSINLWMTLPVRMLNLNVGNCREVLAQIYQEKRNKLLTDDAIYQWVVEKEEMINASGAYLRESERWHDGAAELNLAEISSHVISQMYLLERYIYDIWAPEAAN